VATARQNIQEPVGRGRLVARRRYRAAERMTARGFTRDARRLAAGWRWRLSHLLGTRVPAEFDDELADTVKRVRRCTLSSAARIAALCDGVEYVSRHRIEGAIVECGVWKGGSMMAAALTLLRLGDTKRDLYLFDTYSGMAAPGAEDAPSPYDGYSPQKRWRRNRRGRTSDWAAVSSGEVRRNMEATGYPMERVHLIEGMVEDTLPDRAPETIALLRLDTDWYASTKHELEHLYPGLSEGGVLIVDDYGHYEGARRAVDEYLDESGERLLLSRIDYTGRVAVKQNVPVGAKT
jgi:O-methyltransferase